MNSSQQPKISLMLGYFDRQVLKINSINLDEKNLPDREVYESEDIDWNMFGRVPKDVRDGVSIAICSRTKSECATSFPALITKSATKE